MQPLNPKHLGWLLLCMITSCQAASPKPDTSAWKTECVGHYNIGLPGEVELALANTKVLSDVNYRPQWVFGNGDSAPYSNSIYVTNKLDKDTVNNLKAGAKSAVSEWKSSLEKEGNQLDSTKIKQITSDMPDYFGYIGIGYGELYLFNSPYLFKLVQYGDSAETGLNNFLKFFKTRELYETPTDNASVCVPYGYFKEEKYNKTSGAGITYRLKNHPEIEIMLREAAFQGKRNEEDQLTLFWEYFDTSVKINDGREHGFQDVKLAGYSGKGIYVKITREDDTLDYGYAAVVKASNKHPDNPNLLFYITRTAKRAVGEPMSESEFKQLIEGVVGSIQKR